MSIEFIDAYPFEDLAPRLRTLLQGARRVEGAIAFVTQYGVDLWLEILHAAEPPDARLVVSVRYPTDLAALCRTIDQYKRDHLIDILLAATGPGWSNREEAIVAAARHLAFRRTGTNIRAAFKSAINAALRRGLVERDGATLIRKIRNNG